MTGPCGRGKQMSEAKKSIGEILQDMGRVTQEDIERALEHQRREGGYFGQALVALGVVQQGELEWGLASQFEIPYIFPEASAVDPETAGLVTPEWALANGALPIARIDDRLTLAVDSPLKTEAAEELARKTGLKVELALASSASIRKVIREVFSRDETERDELNETDAVTTHELRSLAHRDGARSWGLSVRGDRALGWYHGRQGTRRFRLRTGWNELLERSLSPSPAERLPARGEGAWMAQFREGGGHSVVDVKGLSTAAGYELLFTPREEDEDEPHVPEPPEEILDELRLILQEGGLILAVRSAPERLGWQLLPHLPDLLLPQGHRSLHLSTREGPPPPRAILTLPLEGPDTATQRRLKELREFRFDSVAVELDKGHHGIWEATLELAPVIFVHLFREHEPGASEKGEEPAPAPEGVTWILDVEKETDGAWTWSLEPVEG